jgi:flagellar hook assembly protein FlgD
VPSEKENITLKIYDVSGRLVKNLALGTGQSAPGTTVMWDGKDDAHKKLPGGVYFLKFSADDYEETKKLMLIR